MQSWVLLVAAVALCAACREDPTQLVIWLETDMDTPDALDAFGTHVGPAGGDVLDERAFTLVPDAASTTTPLASLPASFGVAPRHGDAERRVEVAVTAVKEGETLFTTRAKTSFVAHQRMRLDLFLAEQCIELHEQCEREGKTCSLGGCVDIEVPTGALAPWTGPPEPRDAGAPADAGRDAGPDAAAPDAAVDAATRDAAVADGGELDAAVDAGPDPIDSWAMTLVAGPRTLTTQVAVDGEGTAYVLTSFGEGVNVPGQLLRNEGNSDLLVVAVDRAGGPPRFAQHGAPGASVTVWDAAWDGADGIVVGGTYRGDLTEVSPGFRLLPQGASNGGFVGRLGAAELSFDWVVSFVSPSDAAVNAVTGLPAGNVWVAGAFTDSVDATGVGESPQGTGALAFAARLDADGAAGCLATLTSSDEVRGTGVLGLADGWFAASGRFVGDVDFGNDLVDLGVLTRATYLVVYDAQCLRQDRVTPAWGLLAVDLAASANGQRWILAGEKDGNGDLELDGIVVPARGAEDVAVAAFEGLVPRAAALHGGLGRDAFMEIEGHPGRAPLISGFTRGEADFGPLAPLPPLEGSADGFVVAVGDDAMGLWAMSAQGADAEPITSAAWDPEWPSVFVTGSYHALATVGGLPVDVHDVVNMGEVEGVFLARLRAP